MILKFSTALLSTDTHTAGSRSLNKPLLQGTHSLGVLVHQKGAKTGKSPFLKGPGALPNIFWCSKETLREVALRKINKLCVWDFFPHLFEKSCIFLGRRVMERHYKSLTLVIPTDHLNWLWLPPNSIKRKLKWLFKPLLPAAQREHHASVSEKEKRRVKTWSQRNVSTNKNLESKNCIKVNSPQLVEKILLPWGITGLQLDWHQI